ncbi:MAG: alpha/beta fold hydrolase [Actinobacteria bacterium]|nr:alpha/beta fold hydrolase [Actinomycetota bacterium]
MTDLRIRSSHGLELEAQLEAPPSPRAALVLCHPHPKMGGTMNAPLLVELGAEMNRRGWAVLRFNFRGIGSSEGVSGTGVDEVADARGAIEEVKTTYDVPIGIAGWSFGGAVALRTAAERVDLVGVAGIAPAIKGKAGITAGLPNPGELSLDLPVMIVVGSNDDLVDPRDARDWADAIGGRFLLMKGANHFFWGKYEALDQAIGGFFDSVL